MRKSGWSAFLRKKQYVIAGTLVIVAAIGMTAAYSSEQTKQREEIEEQLANEAVTGQEDVAAEEETAAEEASSVVKPAEKEDGDIAEIAEKIAKNEIIDEKSEEDAKEEVAASVSALHFSAEDGLLWPMEGNVIINYSMDSTVYFATLDQYKYNPAVIIAGEVNDKVISVARGQIVSIENDEVTGCTVTVDLGDGYQAVYGQLKELNFAVGDYLEAGHVIGYLSEPTKYFSVEGSNLYFELLKDGVPVDPIEYFE